MPGGTEFSIQPELRPNYKIETKPKQDGSTPAPTGQQGTPAQEQISTSIFAQLDANKNEYITKEESKNISDWKGQDSNTTRNNLNDTIKNAAQSIAGFATHGDDRQNLINKVFTNLSGKFLTDVAQFSKNILDSFKGIKIGSFEVVANNDVGKIDPEEITRKQTEIDEKATSSVASTIQQFDSDFKQNLQNLLKTYEAEAKAEIEKEIQIKNASKEVVQQEDEYGKPKTREVNGTPTDVYKKDGKHYIKNNGQFEEIFLVNDKGKNKYVTYDVKAQLGLQGKEGDISTKKVEVNGMDGEQNLIRNEGEKVGGHKTYSDTDGNQYIRSNNQYFDMNSNEGILLQNGGKASYNSERDETVIEYNGRSYGVESHKDSIRIIAEDIRQKDAVEEKTTLDGLDNDDKSIRNENGIYRAGDISQTQAKEMVTPIYNDAIKLLSGRDSETTAKWTKTFNEAFKKDIQETFNKNELSTTNLDKATDDFRMEHPIKHKAVTVNLLQFDKENARPRTENLNRKEITTANDVIKNKWGGQNKDNNATIQAAIKENSGITGSYGVINAALDKLGIDFETIDFKAFSKDLIDANPSIFNDKGQLYANANISKLDFPTKEVIMREYGKKEDQAQVQSAPAQTPPTTPPTTPVPVTPLEKKVTPALVKDQPPVYQASQNEAPVGTTPETQTTKPLGNEKGELLTTEEVELYLANDESYQRYQAELDRLDSEMKKIEEKYGIERDDSFGLLAIKKEEWKPYAENSTYLDLLQKNLKKFEKTIREWQDTPKDADVSKNFIQINSTRYTHVRKETLPDGTKVYNTAQGYFKLGPDGYPDGRKMTREELEKHGFKPTT